jgi:two-component system sensor histidine kinase TctE
VVNQLLSMARADARAADAARERIDLDQLATEVVRDFVPRALDKSIDLGYEGPTVHEASSGAGLLRRLSGRGSEARVLGHPLLLRELIINLVDNALQYTPRGGTVTVRVVPDPFGQVVVLQVEDSGPGIPVGERELVFQPFYRPLGNTVEGSGLGLAIVAEIGRQHGTQIDLEDAQPRVKDGAGGPGLKVTLRFACAPPVAELG